MISIIICSIDVEKFNAVSEQFRIALGGEPYEIIRIPNATSMCEGYNRGLPISHGEIVIFCHDDIEIWTDNFAQKLKTYLQTYDVIGVAGTTRLVHPGWIAAGPPHIFGHVPHLQPNGLITLMVYGVTSRVSPNIQAMDGLFLAFRRPVIEHLRWDQQTFTSFHCYDIDCTYRAYRAGYRLAVINDMPIMHMSGGSFDEGWLEQATRLAGKYNLGQVTTAPFARIAIDYPNKRVAMEAVRRMCATLT